MTLETMNPTGQGGARAVCCCTSQSEITDYFIALQWQREHARTAAEEADSACAFKKDAAAGDPFAQRHLDTIIQQLLGLENNT